MPILLITKLLAGTALAGTAATVGVVAFVTPPVQSAAWLDNPANGAVLPVGDALLFAHTNLAAATSIRLVISEDGKAVATLTDTELDRTAIGDKAQPLITFEQGWDATPGAYHASLAVYAGSSVVAKADGDFTVGDPVAPDPDDGPTATAEPSATASASPSASPSATATPSETASAAPSETAEPTSTPKPTTTKPPKTTPTPKPTPQPSVTPQPPPKPLPGKATRSNESNYGWTNTFTITGFRPKTAEMFVDIKLHNTTFTPYYAPAKSYPCGSPTLYEGSGDTATYQCSVTITVEPPGNWKGGEYWFAMPGNIFSSKAIVDGKTYNGLGGNWYIQQKPL